MREPYISGYSLYEAHRGEVERLTGDPTPLWEELDAFDQMYWEAEADELNEARIGAPEGLEQWQ
jgi:hypothetical protein